MGSKAAITVNRPRAEVERLWQSSGHADTPATFKDAPGDRGTEIYVDVEQGGKLAELGQKLTGKEPLAKAKDDLRRFKQLAETGEIITTEGQTSGR